MGMIKWCKLKACSAREEKKEIEVNDAHKTMKNQAQSEKH